MDAEPAREKPENETTSSSKKAEKKTVRALAILKKDTGLGESKELTNIIFVCNAGLVTGCSSSGMSSINIKMLYFYIL